jgi:hypothetical protein
MIQLLGVVEGEQVDEENGLKMKEERNKIKRGEFNKWYQGSCDGSE